MKCVCIVKQIIGNWENYEAQVIWDLIVSTVQVSKFAGWFQIKDKTVWSLVNGWRSFYDSEGNLFFTARQWDPSGQSNTTLSVIVPKGRHLMNREEKREEVDERGWGLWKYHCMGGDPDLISEEMRPVNAQSFGLIYTSPLTLLTHRFDT